MHEFDDGQTGDNHILNPKSELCSCFCASVWRNSNSQTVVEPSCFPEPIFLSSSKGSLVRPRICLERTISFGAERPVARIKACAREGGSNFAGADASFAEVCPLRPTSNDGKPPHQAHKFAVEKPRMALSFSEITVALERDEFRFVQR